MHRRSDGEPCGRLDARGVDVRRDDASSVRERSGVASNAASGAINPSSSPLWIGGNSPFGEYFAGLIDDVRIYNRALTQLEIQTDMATPLGG